MCTLDIHPMLRHQHQIRNPFAYEYSSPSPTQFYWQRADNLDMVNMKEAQPPCCNRCQKMPCTCAHNGMVPIPPPHLVLPLEIRLQNYTNPIYPRDQNFLLQNPVYSMDHNNLLSYHNLPMMIPANGPLLSPPSSASPPSPQSSPATNRPRKVKKFKCNVCSNIFHYKHVLQNHLRIHTGEKPFECTVCGNKFTRDHHLKTHMRLHTGEKPFSCTFCDMRFVQVANLRRHLRTHDPITCDICDKRFPDLNCLKRHSIEHNLGPNGVCDLCHIIHHPDNDCPLRMNRLRISHDDDSDAVSSGDSHTSNGSDQNVQYEETEIIEVLDLSTAVKNSTQNEPEDLSMKKYY